MDGPRVSGVKQPSDLVYSSSWDGNTDAASKNAIYDKIEAALAGAGSGSVLDGGLRFTGDGLNDGGSRV